MEVTLAVMVEEGERYEEEVVVAKLGGDAWEAVKVRERDIK